MRAIVVCGFLMKSLKKWLCYLAGNSQTAPTFFFQIFMICFFKNFIKNPQTKIALKFSTHINSGIDGVNKFSYITRSWKNCLPCCNFPQPLVKHMSSVSSQPRKLLEVGKQAGWTLILNFKGLPSFRITKSFSNVLPMNFIPSSSFQTICAMSLVWEKKIYIRYVRLVKPRQQYP